jgi:PAS domain S-box-containing protein
MNHPKPNNEGLCAESHAPRDRLAPTGRPDTERREAHGGPGTDEDGYRLLFEKNPLPLWVFDQDTLVFLAVNEAAVRHFGYAREELLAKTIRDICPAGDVPHLLRTPAHVLARPAAAGPLPASAWRHRKKDGTVVDVAVTLSRISFRGRGAVLAVATDIIPERRCGEDALREPALLLSCILESMGDGVVVADTRGRFLCCNPAAEQIAGIRRWDLPPEEWTREYGVFLPDGVTPYPPADLPLARAIRGESVDQAELLLRPARAPQGKWLNVTARPLTDDQGTLLGGMVVFRDVTRRRQEEELLRSTEARFHVFMDNSPAVAFMKDERGRFVYFNQSFQRMHGASHQWLGKTVREVFPPETASQLEARQAAVFAGEKTIETHEVVPLADGSPCEWLVYRFPFRDASGQRFLGGVALDVTDRRRMEEALRQTNQTLQSLIQASPLAIITLGVDWTVTTWNPAAERIFGWRAEEVRGQPLPIIPADQRAEAQAFREAELKGEPRLASELRRLRKDGTLVDVSISTAPLCDARGAVVGTIGVVADITDRKRAEAALRESEERHRLIAELTSDYTYDARVEPDGTIRVEYASEGFARVTGYTVAEVDARGGWACLIHPEDLPMAEARAQPIWAGERDVNELRIVTKGGEIRWIRYSTQPLRDPAQGRVVRLLGAVQDITERRRAEAALQALSRHNELILRAAGEGIYGLDRNGTATFVNPAAARMLGWQAGELVGRPLHQILHHSRPDGTPYPIDACPIYAAFKDGTAHQVANEVFWRKDGTSFPVEYVSTPIWEDGRLAGAVVVFKDVTERRQAEREQQQYAGRLRILSRRLLEVQEVERRHLARELHDEVGQLLTGLKLTLEARTRRARGEAGASLDDATGLVQELLGRVRALSLRLRPTMLDDLGLRPALHWQVERYTAQTGVQVAFQTRGLERRFPPGVETAAYRIVQEALTNVARHARVRAAAVRIWLEGDWLSLRVEDQGVGFDYGAALARGASGGLSGIHERAALLGGHLTVESKPGGGTCVAARLPIQGEAEGALPTRGPLGGE